MREMVDVPTSLVELADLYRQRNDVYGDDYKQHGHIMKALFEYGVHLHSPSDFNRYAILQNIVTKLNRYLASWEKGGHADSLDDISVYAQMLKELDHER